MIYIPEEIKNKWNSEFEEFADTQEARDFCFGNYNNATRDEQVGRYCYIAAKISSYEREQKYKYEYTSKLRELASRAYLQSPMYTGVALEIERLDSEQRETVKDYEIKKLQERIKELENELHRT